MPEPTLHIRPRPDDSFAPIDGGPSGIPAPVTIRDRRELPFFQVRLKAVQAIRNEVGGPRRLRTIGFYALLCQLANEQRHTGEHRRLQFTYDTLASRGGVAKRNIKLMLDFLQRADVVRYERLTDSQRGATISTLHLLIQDGAWTAITVAMADRLAAPRAGGHLLRELGLVIALLEFCIAQREQLHGTSAAVTRPEIARQAGLTIDRVDQCNRLLQAAGLLTITRRRPLNGGRNLASLYLIHEAPLPSDQEGETELAGPQTETTRAESRNPQGPKPVLAGPQNGTGRAEELNRQSGISAISGTKTPPSNTHTGANVEKSWIEEPPASPDLQPGGGGAEDPAESLCLAFLTVWEPVLGHSPQHDYHAHHRQWQAAASRLLKRHTRDRLDRALEQMLVDEIVGSRALTLPAFEKVADQLIARHHARRHQTRSPNKRATVDQLGWQDAKEHLQRAVQRYGRDHRDQALTELTAHDPLLVEFVHRVRWSALCEQPIQYVERRYAELWSEIVDQSRQQREEPAA